MHSLSQNVLPLSDPPRQKTFRAAVAKVIRQSKACHDLTNVELGERVGCHGDTISNAENEHNDLNPATLLRIAYEFGEDAIAPVRELYLHRHVEPETPSEKFDRIARELDSLKRETVGA